MARAHVPLGAGLVLALGALGLALGLAGGGGCATKASKQVAYAPEAFRTALADRVPDLPERLSAVPFVVPEEIVDRARRAIRARPHGPARVRALVDVLMEPEPKGLGLHYDWQATATASRTLERGRGNCLALASVLVGVGRGLGWPVYYAEARGRELASEEMGDLKVLVDHIVVVVASKTVRMVVDFTGLVDDRYRIRIIDDLSAYAHVVNNVAAHHIIAAGAEAGTVDWEVALEGFQLAIRIQPTLGRAWNNLGLALSRLGHVEQARIAYARAVELDDGLGAAGRNLAILETRARGGPSLLQGDP